MKLFAAIRSLLSGLSLTGQHFRKIGHTRGAVGIGEQHYFEDADKAVTIQYPHEKIPVPDHGRYQLHMEEDDCIVCDKCARICPVDCIDIVGFKTDKELGYTSDGSKKRIELGVFDIDMAKCCFCGLCTTVCPTECLTMTPEYDFSTYNRQDLTFSFASMTSTEVVRKQEEATAAKAARQRPQANS